jgi:hypothetical protein
MNNEYFKNYYSKNAIRLKQKSRLNYYRKSIRPRRKLRRDLSPQEMANLLMRDCPSCHTKINYSNFSNKSRADKRNAPCEKCQGQNLRGIRRSESHKLKISIANTGHKWTPEQRERLSNAKTGIKLTSEHKRKLREARVKELQSKFNTVPNYNSNACRYFDRLSLEKGWNLTHALNGGEVTRCGYFLDAYDPSNNIVIEYDEKKHRGKRQKLRDEQKQSELIAELKCQFYRYDEINNTLLKVS